MIISIRNVIVFIILIRNADILIAQNGYLSANLRIIYNISNEYKNIGVHGIDFFENNVKLDSSMVIVYFDLINQLSKIDLNQYSVDSIKQDKYTIRKYHSSQNKNPYCLIEIVTQDSTKNKKIPIKKINNLILSDLYPSSVELEFDENRLVFFKIEDSKIMVVRESILFIDDDFDNKAFNESRQLIEKYKINNP